MPPSSFTFLKYAPIALPIVPYAEAGPLYGFVLPSLISVAVTPGVWATAGSTPASASVRARAHANGILSLMIASLGGRCRQRGVFVTQLRGRVNRFHESRKAPAMPCGMTYMNTIRKT